MQDIEYPAILERNQVFDHFCEIPDICELSIKISDIQIWQRNYLEPDFGKKPDIRSFLTRYRFSGNFDQIPDIWQFFVEYPVGPDIRQILFLRQLGKTMVYVCVQIQ